MGMYSSYERVVLALIQEHGGKPYEDLGEEIAAPFPYPDRVKLEDLTPTQWEYLVLPLVERYLKPSYGLYQYLSAMVGKSITPAGAGWMWVEEVTEHGFEPCEDKRVYLKHQIPAYAKLYQRPHGAKRIYLQVYENGRGCVYTSKSKYPVKSWAHLEVVVQSIPCEPKPEKTGKKAEVLIDAPPLRLVEGE